MTAERIRNSLVLSPQDIQGATWNKVLQYLNQRLDTKRAENDNSKTIEGTEKLRGRIAEIKNLMSLGQPEPEYETQVGFDDS